MLFLTLELDTQKGAEGPPLKLILVQLDLREEHRPVAPRSSLPEASR